MKALFSTGLIFLGVVLAACVAETGLRCMGFRPSASAERHCATWACPDPKLGWRNRPGVWKVDREDRPMTILPDGLRKTCWQENVAENAPLIVILGDSWIMGYGLNDEQTFESLLQKRFPSVRFLNCAAAGYGTYQNLLFLEDYLPKAKKEEPGRPVRVLYCLCGHIQIRNVAGYAWIKSLTTIDGTHFTPPHILRDESGAWKRYPATRHNLWSLADKSAIVYLIQDVLIFSRTRDNEKQSLAATQHLLKEMKELCDRNAVPFQTVIADAPKREIELYEAFCSSSDIQCVSCALDVEWKDPQWFLHNGNHRGGHPNERFHAFWASSIGDFLESQGWAKP